MQLIDRSLLRAIEPINSLSPENFEEIARNTYLQYLAPNEILFRIGETDNYKYYLIEGEIEIINQIGDKSFISSNDDASQCIPLDNYKPRRYTARARTELLYIRIDGDLLDILLTWDQSNRYMVSELSNKNSMDSDWMIKVLESNVFCKIPPQKIQSMFMHMDKIEVSAGTKVVKQGDRADYYYFLHSGSCQVTRHVPEAGADIVLANIRAGEGFGEEALLANTIRNATVTMVTDGVLMRLASKDFNDVIVPTIEKYKRPMVERLREQGAQLIDVRADQERFSAGFKGSINIPFFVLRYKVAALDRSKKYIVYCETGHRSLAAAYILKEKGFDAAVLEDGLLSVANYQAA